MTTDGNPLSENTVDRLKELSTSVVADTEHESVCVLSNPIQPIHDDCFVVGTVQTSKINPSAIQPPIQALSNAKEGQVIVVDTGNVIKEAVWGESLSTYATTAGITGVVTNGAVRDISEIQDLGFPVFAQASTPRGPSGNEVVETNVPVTVGKTLIYPGDVLLGDKSGVVIIRHDAVDEVITSAEAIDEADQEVQHRIDDGDSLEDIFKYPVE